MEITDCGFSHKRKTFANIMAMEGACQSEAQDVAEFQCIACSNKPEAALDVANCGVDKCLTKYYEKSRQFFSLMLMRGVGTLFVVVACIGTISYDGSVRGDDAKVCASIRANDLNVPKRT